jgi:hypothetical protein
MVADGKEGYLFVAKSGQKKKRKKGWDLYKRILKNKMAPK